MATADTTTDDGGRTPFVSIVARIAEHARRTPDKDAIVFVRHAPEGLEAELTECGFVVDGAWRSEGSEFQLTLCHPYC